jgi:hypothetical protein
VQASGEESSGSVCDTNYVHLGIDALLVVGWGERHS